MGVEINEELETAIENIANESKVTAMSLTIRDIQKLVNDELGYEPSTSTVARVLRRIGIDTSSKGRHRWVYKHKASHE